jgi:thiol-disulfide isomerase/thioredoxin
MHRGLRIRSGPLRRCFTVCIAVANALWWTACSRPTVPAWRADPRPQPGRLHVLMINGGGSPASNYQSHLIHLQQLVDLLESADIPTARIAIFDADGSDPSPDLAVREQQPEAEFWRLHGTPLEPRLRTQVTFADSSVHAAVLQPATRADLGRWFETVGPRLRPGDTLLLYVTDHGSKNANDLADNSITLWGDNESLSVRQLQAMLRTLDPGVRVVALMSQCFSGSFAELMNTQSVDGLPSGAVCGYFSSTADRPAYGCYPENRGRENVGHSFHFIQALAQTGSFPQAQDRVLSSDATPDVPLRTSDVFLEQMLRRAADAGGRDFDDSVDALLQQAWQDKARWEPEIRLLDHIGEAFGCFSPRSLAELDRQAHALPDIAKHFKAVSGAWSQASAEANQAGLTRFLAEEPEWVDRFDDPSAPILDGVGTRVLAANFLNGLTAFEQSEPRTEKRIALLNAKHRDAAAASYRMEVRLAVVLRMRTILTSIAGRVYLATAATAAERSAYDTLRACEDLRLPPTTAPGPGLLVAESFPPFDEDVQQAKEALPAWMGIRFREPSATQRVKYNVGAGAAVVLTVYPDSPAETAGLQSGDIINGTPGESFTEPRQLRAWTMLSTVGHPQQIDVVRDGRRRQLTLVPGPYPLTWPELPGPPKVGSAAPALKQITAYRGSLPKLARGTPTLLFFWATWCAPCKAALPEVLAFERERHTPVLAITDEAPEKLDAFFKIAGEFPENVAVDEYRNAFVAYGVSGTPTFVLIDGDGRVRSYATGYAASKGLAIDGWKWAKETRQGGDG